MQLNERILEKGILIESNKANLPDGVLCRVKYPIFAFDQMNANKRIYEVVIGHNLLSNSEVREKIKNRNLFGHAEHPQETQSNLERVSHCVTDMMIVETDNKMYQVFDVLDTPTGRIVDTLLRAECLVGCSTRAEGDLEEKEDNSGNKYHRVIPESYHYITTDFTADPSTYSSVPIDIKRNIISTAKKELSNEKANESDKQFATLLLESMKCEGDVCQKCGCCETRQKTVKDLINEKLIKIGDKVKYDNQDAEIKAINENTVNLTVGVGKPTFVDLHGDANVSVSPDGIITVVPVETIENAIDKIKTQLDVDKEKENSDEELEENKIIEDETTADYKDTDTLKIGNTLKDVDDTYWRIKNITVLGITLEPLEDNVGTVKFVNWTDVPSLGLEKVNEEIELYESKAIKDLYKKAGLPAPKGKGEHTMAFHRLAIKIAKGYVKSGDAPKEALDKAYPTAMDRLGPEKAVKKAHRRKKNESVNERDKKVTGDLIGIVDEYGYDIVDSADRNKIIYHADNHRLDSGQLATPGTEFALTIEELEEYAEQTGKEIADENNVKYLRTEVNESKTNEKERTGRELRLFDEFKKDHPNYDYNSLWQLVDNLIEAEKQIDANLAAGKDSHIRITASNESIGMNRYTVKPNPTKGWDIWDTDRDEKVETWEIEEKANDIAKSMNESIFEKFEGDLRDMPTRVLVDGKPITGWIKNRDAKMIAIMLEKAGMSDEKRTTFEFEKGAFESIRIKNECKVINEGKWTLTLKQLDTDEIVAIEKIIDELKDKFTTQEETESRIDVICTEIAQKFGLIYHREGNELIFSSKSAHGLEANESKLNEKFMEFKDVPINSKFESNAVIYIKKTESEAFNIAAKENLEFSPDKLVSVLEESKINEDEKSDDIKYIKEFTEAFENRFKDKLDLKEYGLSKFRDYLGYGAESIFTISYHIEAKPNFDISPAYSIKDAFSGKQQAVSGEYNAMLWISTGINPAGITGKEDLKRDFTIHYELKGDKKITQRRWVSNDTILKFYGYALSMDEIMNKFETWLNAKYKDFMDKYGATKANESKINESQLKLIIEKLIEEKNKINEDEFDYYVHQLNKVIEENKDSEYPLKIKIQGEKSATKWLDISNEFAANLLELFKQGKIRPKYTKESISSTVKQITNLKIKEATARAERDKCIEELEDLANVQLEKKMLLTKIKEIKESIGKSDEEIDGLRTMLENKAINVVDYSKKLEQAEVSADNLKKELEEANNKLNELSVQIDKDKEDAKKQLNAKESELNKEFENKLDEVKTEAENKAKKDLLKDYFNKLLTEHNLKVHKNTQALLERCTAISDVDRLVSNLIDVSRKGALHSTTIRESKIEETPISKEDEKAERMINVVMEGKQIRG